MTEDNVAGWEQAGNLLVNRQDVVARAHLLANTLGGDGGVRRNLAVTCQTDNQDMYTRMESYVKDWIKNGSTVDYEVTVEYEGNSPYPKAFQMKASRLNVQSSRNQNRPICEERKQTINSQTDIRKCPGAELR